MGIQVPPDSTGKVVETNSPDGATQRQVVTVGDKTTALNVLSISAGGAAKVDNSAVTQPISAVSLPLPTGAALDATLTGGTAKTQVYDGVNVIGTSLHPVRTDPTGTTTQPVSGTVATTPPANASTNVAQLAGVAPDLNSGVKGGGTLRVVIATDQPALTNKLLVTADAVTQGTSPWVTQESPTIGVTLARVSSNPASSGDNTIIAAQGVGKVIYVYAYSLSFSGTVNAKFTDGAAGTQLAFHYGVANSGGGEATKPPAYLFKTTSNTALILNLSGAVAAAVNLSYFVI